MKSLINYEGKLGAWGKKSGNKIVPSKGHVFYGIGDIVWVVLPQQKPTPKALERFVRENEDLQVELFGQTYASYQAQAVKKKKGKKKGVYRRCYTAEKCSGNCQALVDEKNNFLGCEGECCTEGGGFYDFFGAAETWETASGR
ncbi:MAG: hypothetical protein KTR24_09225 [Saprospiraceae bacterium]|nr:hypothetical protein [Saprospiraceae bacterium]